MESQILSPKEADAQHPAPVSKPLLAVAALISTGATVTLSSWAGAASVGASEFLDLSHFSRGGIVGLIVLFYFGAKGRDWAQFRKVMRFVLLGVGLLAFATTAMQGAQLKNEMTGAHSDSTGSPKAQDDQPTQHTSQNASVDEQNIPDEAKAVMDIALERAMYAVENVDRADWRATFVDAKEIGWSIDDIQEQLVLNVSSGEMSEEQACVLANLALDVYELDELLPDRELTVQCATMLVPLIHQNTQ